ncbi:MAG: hypothetical protein CL677_02515 [Bdellovibrionaceae bacterium]|nr:hypothetical protein [Pseudobdellovibrionaceae bacterium]
MRILVVFIATLSCALAWAQNSSTNHQALPYWLGVGLIYNQMDYEEPDVMTEKGANGGLHLDVGYLLLPNISVNLDAKYWDGRLKYDGATFGGTPVKTQTADILSDNRIYFNYSGATTTFSVGYGQRYWYNDLIISYRRKTTYNFVPLKGTLRSGSFYYSFEYNLWLGGVNKSFMSDTGGGRNDVTMDLDSGSGMALEWGYVHGATPVARAFLRIEKWDVDDSETAFDGVDNLVEPKNNTLTIMIGSGLIW